MTANKLKISCLNIHCPERDGGQCMYDPRSPYTKQQQEVSTVWERVQEVIDEFGHDPTQCLEILEEYAQLAQQPYIPEVEQ